MSDTHASPAAPALDPLLLDLADSVAGAETLEELARPLLELLESVTGMQSTYLTAVDEQAGLQRIRYAHNTGALDIPEGLTVPWHDTLCRRAIAQDVRHTDDVPGLWGDSAAARALGIASYASVPVRDGEGALRGTLCAASTRRVPLAANAGKVLGLCAQLIAQQIERERLVAELREANRQLASFAMVDALTGLPNRRALRQELARMLARRDRDGGRQASGQLLHVAFVDLDGFKAINDRHGHEAGDRLLVAVGRALVHGLRAGDLVARHGGDELVVVAPAGDAASDAERERFRGLVEGLTAVRVPLDADAPGAGELPGGVLDYPGGSVGVVTAAGGEEVDVVLARADAAMYATKQRRRAQR